MNNINIMESSDSWNTSTPSQCRHDSGYDSYLNYCGFLELSPIRKQPCSNFGIQNSESKVKSVGSSDKIIPKKLCFLNSSNANDDDSSENDSGVASITNESISEHEDASNKNIQCVIDENSNFTCLIGSATINNVYQPSKYICKDHLCEKKSSCKINLSKNTSKIRKGYTIVSDLFKFKPKNAKIDFLNELDNRNCTSIICDILSCLSGEDLRQANNVSKTWRDIISNDKCANERRILYIKNKKNATCGPNKENKVETAIPTERIHKNVFTAFAITNLKNGIKQPLIFDIIEGRFDSFIREQKMVENKKPLMKCPKCCYPAKNDVEFKYCCTRKLCKHEFCEKCLGPFLDNHKCSMPKLSNSLSNVIVGSKKSRQNLRRLKA